MLSRTHASKLLSKLTERKASSFKQLYESERALRGTVNLAIVQCRSRLPSAKLQGSPRRATLPKHGGANRPQRTRVAVPARANGSGACEGAKGLGGLEAGTRGAAASAAGSGARGAAAAYHSRDGRHLTHTRSF